MKEIFYNNYIIIKQYIQQCVNKFIYTPSIYDKYCIIYETFEDNSNILLYVVSISIIYVYIIPLFYYTPIIYLLHALSPPSQLSIF